jgi:hypothetical protein
LVQKDITDARAAKHDHQLRPKRLVALLRFAVTDSRRHGGRTVEEAPFGECA